MIILLSIFVLIILCPLKVLAHIAHLAVFEPGVAAVSAVHWYAVSAAGQWIQDIVLVKVPAIRAGLGVEVDPQVSRCGSVHVAPSYYVLFALRTICTLSLSALYRTIST